MKKRVLIPVFFLLLLSPLFADEKPEWLKNYIDSDDTYHYQIGWGPTREKSVDDALFEFTEVLRKYLLLDEYSIEGHDKVSTYEIQKRVVEHLKGVLSDHLEVRETIEYDPSSESMRFATYAAIESKKRSAAYGEALEMLKTLIGMAVQAAGPEEAAPEVVEDDLEETVQDLGWLTELPAPDDDYFYVRGSARSMNLRLSMQQAQADARANAARQLDSEVEVVIRSNLSEVLDEKSVEEYVYELVYKVTSDIAITGTVTVATHSADDGTFYTLLGVPVVFLKQALANSENAVRTVIEGID